MSWGHFQLLLFNEVHISLEDASSSASLGFCYVVLWCLPHGQLSPSKYMGGTHYAAPLTSSLMSSNQWVDSGKQELQFLSQRFLMRI